MPYTFKEFVISLGFFIGDRFDKWVARIAGRTLPVLQERIELAEQSVFIGEQRAALNGRRDEWWLEAFGVLPDSPEGLDIQEQERLRQTRAL